MSLRRIASVNLPDTIQVLCNFVAIHRWNNTSLIQISHANLRIKTAVDTQVGEKVM
jgi:hypothetical protein